MWYYIQLKVVFSMATSNIVQHDEIKKEILEKWDIHVDRNRVVPDEETLDYVRVFNPEELISVLHSDEQFAGVVALGLYVAKVDDDYCDAEKQRIQNVIGMAEKKAKKESYLVLELKNILEADYDFEDIKRIYFREMTKEILVPLDCFVKSIIVADKKIMASERNFYFGPWSEYCRTM